MRSTTGLLFCLVNGHGFMAGLLFLSIYLITKSASETISKDTVAIQLHVQDIPCIAHHKAIKEAPDITSGKMAWVIIFR